METASLGVIHSPDALLLQLLHFNMSSHKADGQEIGDLTLYLCSLVSLLSSTEGGMIRCKIQNTQPAKHSSWSTYLRPDDVIEHNFQPDPGVKGRDLGVIAGYFPP